MTLTLDQSLATTPLGVQPLNFLPQRSYMSIRGYGLAYRFIEESAYGQTPGSPSAIKFVPEDFTVKSGQPYIPNEDLDSTRTEREGCFGNQDVSGSVVAKLNAKWMVYWLKHLLGNNATTGSNPYTHTLTAAALPEGFEIEVDYGAAAGNSRYELYKGLRINQANFTFPVSGFATVSFDFVGATSTLSASPADATVTDVGHEPFNGHEIALTEGGSALATCTQLTMTVANNLETGDTSYALGSGGVRNSLEEGKCRITINGMFKFDNDALLQKAKNATETSLIITVSRGTGLGSSGNESITFTLPQFKYEPTSAEIRRNGPVLIPFKATMYRSAGGTAPLTIVAKNAIASI